MSTLLTKSSPEAQPDPGPPLPERREGHPAELAAAGIELSQPPLDDEPAESPPAKPAKPRPGDAGYDWSAHYDTDDLYVHTFPDGTVVAIKSMRVIYSRTWLYKLRKAQSDAEFEFAALDRAACPEATAVLEHLDDSAGDPIADLFRAWSAAATGSGDGDKGLTRGN